MSQLDTTITAVTVYPDRARIARHGAIKLQTGEHELEIAELPLSLDPDSVRASARGTARARLLGVSVRRDFYVETPAERVRELDKQVEMLEDDMRTLDAQKGLLEGERAALAELSGQTEVYARGLAFAKTSPEAQMILFDQLHNRAEQVNTNLQDLAIRQRDLKRRLDKAQNELAKLQEARGRGRYTASVEVEVLQAGELTVELTYVVSNAGWTPLYDLRLLEQDQKPTLEVGYLAQVTQRAGEDWADATFTLSTARPALAETLPELDPWYVGPVYAVEAEARKRHFRPPPAPAMADMDKEVATGAALEDVVEAEPVVATVEASGAAVTYRLPGAVSIPADGEPHKVTVARFLLAPELDYVAAPKLVEAAYRRAQVSNDSPYTLLPGPANLFAGDEFIGTTKLELTAPQGEIELYLGVDDRIKVTRELKRRDVDKRFIGDKRRLHYGYEISLENLLPAEAQIALHDQIPVPRHQDIEVKLDQVEPKPSRHSDLNLLDWELSLKPGEKQSVRLDFSVEHPKSMSLMGLP